MPDWLARPPATLDDGAMAAAGARQRELTKPPGSLGALERLALRLAAMQGTPLPAVDPVRIVVFAADHGVAAEGVSAYPQSVTTEMVRNFAAGGAAVSVLARTLGAALEVVDVGTVDDPGPLAGVVRERIVAGTANFVRGPAMSAGQCAAALEAGRRAVQRARAGGARLFIGGDMGIGNSSAAAALACAWLGRPASALCGRGTGIDDAGVARKAALVEAALAHHRDHLLEPLETLRRLGGLEIAALAGAFVCAAQDGLPVLVDGFIAGAAALAAARLCPGATAWFIHAHRSAERGHGELLNALGGEPLLDLGMRLGEGSGAAVALPLLRLACALHAGMATFAEAGVSCRHR